MYDSDLIAIRANLTAIECTQNPEAIIHNLGNIIRLAKRLQDKVEGDQHALHIPATKDD